MDISGSGGGISPYFPWFFAGAHDIILENRNKERSTWLYFRHPSC
jgi:hypothetical protein